MICPNCKVESTKLVTHKSGLKCPLCKDPETPNLPSSYKLSDTSN